MIKSVVYLLATLLGIGLTFQAPVWGAVLNVAAYLMNPQLVASEFPEFRYQFWAAVALMLSALVHGARGLSPAGGEGWLLKCLWVYVFITFLSGMWAVHSSQQAWDAAYDFFKTIVVVAFFVLVIRSEADLVLVIWACLIGAAHGAFMHVIGWRIDWIPASYGQPGWDPGAMIEYQGMVVSLFVPLLLLFAIFARNWYGRIFCWLALPLALDSMVNTYMRTVFISLVFELVLLVVLMPRRVFWTLLPIVGCGLVLFLFVFTPDTYWERMDTITTPTEEASAASRFAINEASTRMIQDHPLGVGYRNYIDVSPQYLDLKYLDYTYGYGRRSAHNSYLSVLCETGWLGFGAWMAVIIGTLLLFRDLRKTIDKQRLTQLDLCVLGCEIGFYGWLAGGLTSSLHEMDVPYWFIAFAVIVKRVKHQQALAQ